MSARESLMRLPRLLAQNYVPTRADLAALAAIRPHRPAKFSELGWPGRLRRVGGLLALASVGAMTVSASTASTDWDVTGDGPPHRG